MKILIYFQKLTFYLCSKYNLKYMHIAAKFMLLVNVH